MKPVKGNVAYERVTSTAFWNLQPKPLRRIYTPVWIIDDLLVRHIVWEYSINS